MFVARVPWDPRFFVGQAPCCLTPSFWGVQLNAPTHYAAHFFPCINGVHMVYCLRLFVLERMGYRKLKINGHVGAVPLLEFLRRRFGIMLRFAISMVSILFLFSMAFGEVPPMISFQGVLSDSIGIPVEDDVYAIKFAIYDDSTSGLLLWETAGFVPIPTRNGLFTHILGSTNPIPDSVFRNRAYVGYQIEGNPEMRPHTALQSVPFSYLAKNSEFAIEADKVDGLEGAALEESQEIGNALNQHSNALGHLSLMQLQELTSGGFTTLHNHSIMPPENIFRVVIDVGPGGQHSIFTTSADKVRYITNIRHGRVSNSTGGYGYYFSINGNTVINWDPAYGQPIWTSDGGAPMVVGPNETFSVNCDATGFIIPIIVVGYEFDYVSSTAR